MQDKPSAKGTLADGNPFFDVHYANNLLLEVALKLDQKPWDAAAARSIAMRLREVGYKLDLCEDEAAAYLKDLERSAPPGKTRFA